MYPSRRLLIGAGLAATLPPTRPRAQPADAIRIGVLTDLSGPNRDNGGPVSVACVRQAVEEFTRAKPEARVEVLVSDHQNKVDVGLGTAREWFDRGGVDMITDVSNSALALALRTLAEERDKVAIVTSAGTSDLTGKSCSRNLLHWSWDTWCLSHSTGTALVKVGGDKWFFITPNYAFGRAAQEDTTRFVEEAGGKVLGSTSYPFPGTTDFSAYLLEAQASGANVIAFANAGTDLSNCVKQAQEFGLVRKGVWLAALIGTIVQVQALGLDAAQGLLMTETFYWDLNDRTRSLMARLKPKLPANTVPNLAQAGAYSGTINYLRAADRVGLAQAKASGRAMIDAMKAQPTDDDAFGACEVRVDGRFICPAYLFQVKSPSESRGPGDVFKLVATTPSDQAFRPLSEGGCPLVR